MSKTALLRHLASFDPPAPRASLAASNCLVSFMPMAAMDAENPVARTITLRAASEVLSGYTYFQTGDVLVAKITPCFENGKTARACIGTEHGFGTTEFHVIRTKQDRLDAKYLTHFLRQSWVVAEGQRKMTGSAGQRRVPRHYLEKLDIPLPTVEEQRRIAAILDQAEALRAKRRQALAKLDTLTQSLFHEMFGDPATNRNSWPQITLGSACELITDGEHQTPRRSQEGFKLLSARNVRNGFLDFSDVDHVDMSEYARITARYKPQREDVLISCSGSIGRVAAIRTDEPLCLVRSAALLRANRDLVCSDYLEAWLLLPFMTKKMQRRANASGQANLFQNQIRELPILIPDLTRQEHFVRVAKCISVERETSSFSSMAIDKLFQSLQHRAFRGEL